MSEEGIKATLFFHISCARDVMQENGAMLYFHFQIPWIYMHTWWKKSKVIPLK